MTARAPVPPGAEWSLRIFFLWSAPSNTGAQQRSLAPHGVEHSDRRIGTLFRERRWISITRLCVDHLTRLLTFGKTPANHAVQGWR